MRKARKATRTAGSKERNDSDSVNEFIKRLDHPLKAELQALRAIILTPARWLVGVFLVASSLTSFAQCNPGPATGGGIDRCYDDGYVYVDITGNAGGYTWYWGYQSSSQIQSSFIVFHARTNLTAYVTQMLTDTYNLGGLILPPAPYSGTFQGPGLSIPDAPVSRSTNVINLLPGLSIENTETNTVVVSWPFPSVGWTLQQNTNFIPQHWTDLQTMPTNNGTINWVTLPRALGRTFYRLAKPL